MAVIVLLTLMQQVFEVLYAFQRDEISGYFLPNNNLKPKQICGAWPTEPSGIPPKNLNRNLSTEFTPRCHMEHLVVRKLGFDGMCMPLFHAALSCTSCVLLRRTRQKCPQLLRSPSPYPLLYNVPCLYNELTSVRIFKLLLGFTIEFQVL